MCGTPGAAVAQGRYAPKGAASRHAEEGDRLRKAGDRLRIQGDQEAATARWTEAAERFEAARAADPAYLDARVQLGMIYYRLDASPKALAPLTEALEQDSENLDVLFWLGQNEIRAGKSEAGAARLETVVSRTERFPEAWLSIGKHHYTHKAFARAKPAFEAYLALKPDATAARAKLGNTCFKLKLFAKALSQFERVREVWPDNVLVQVNIGNAHFQLGNYPEAVKALTAALAKDPQRESALFNLAQSLFQLGRYAQSVPFYKRYLARKPSSFNGLYFLGSAQLKLDELDGALEALKAAIALKSKVPEAHYKIGLIHLRRGQSDAAKAALGRAARLRKNDPWITSAQGTVARQQGRLGDALVLHKEAVRLKAGSGLLLANLALSQLKSADHAGAYATAKSALDAMDTDPWVQSVVRTVYAAHAKDRAAAGDPRGAAEVLTAALKLGPDAVLSADLALALLAQDRLDAATVAAKTALGSAPDAAVALLAMARCHLANSDAAAADALLVRAQAHTESAAQGAAIAVARGAALLGQGRGKAAVELLVAAKRSWPKSDAVTTALAVAHAAHLLDSLKRSSSTAPRTALRAALGAEAQLKCTAEGCAGPITAQLAARIRYAALIYALRGGDGAAARQHLGRLNVLRRHLPKKTRLFGGKGSAQHLDLLHAWTNVLLGRADRAAELLAPLRASRRAGTTAGKLMQAIRSAQASALLSKGALRKASKALQAALKLGRSPALSHNLAVIWWRQGKHQRAESTWRTVAKSVPTAQFNLAIAAERRGDHEAAWRAFEKAAALGGPMGAQAQKRAQTKARIFRFSK